MHADHRRFHPTYRFAMDDAFSQQQSSEQTLLATV